MPKSLSESNLIERLEGVVTAFKLVINRKSLKLIYESNSTGLVVLS